MTCSLKCTTTGLAGFTMSEFKGITPDKFTVKQDHRGLYEASIGDTIWGNGDTEEEARSQAKFVWEVHHNPEAWNKAMGW